MARRGRCPYMTGPAVSPPRPARMDLIVPTDRGLYCAAGDFTSIRGVRSPRDHHPCARGPCRPGSDLYVCHRDTRRSCASASATSRSRRSAYGETLTRTASRSRSIRRATCSARRRCASRIAARSGSPPATTSSRPTASRPLRAAALPRLHRRIDLRPADLSLAAAGRDLRRHRRLVARQRRRGRASVLFAYALGKAQRVLAHVDASIGPIVCTARSSRSTRLPAGRRRPAADAVVGEVDGQARLRRRADGCPPSAAASPWLNRFGDYSDALASGWMQVRGNRRRRGLDRGFVLSDHADWPGLLQAIADAGAGRVIVTHGTVGPLTRYLRKKGLDARILPTPMAKRRRPRRRRRHDCLARSPRRAAFPFPLAGEGEGGGSGQARSDFAFRSGERRKGPARPPTPSRPRKGSGAVAGAAGGHEGLLRPLPAARTRRPRSGRSRRR